MQSDYTQSVVFTIKPHLNDSQRYKCNFDSVKCVLYVKQLFIQNTIKIDQDLSKKNH